MEQNNGQRNGAPNGAQQVPLNANPLLKVVPVEGQPAAANEPVNGPANDAVRPSANVIGEMDEAARSRASMRWVLPLAGLGLVASRENWSERVGAALENANENAWRRLRRAGRLGRRAPARRDNVRMADETT
jgi:hypothetical protein